LFEIPLLANKVSKEEWTMKKVALKAILEAFLERLVPVLVWHEFDIVWQRAG
jgi:hypothetical protein